MVSMQLACQVPCQWGCDACRQPGSRLTLGVVHAECGPTTGYGGRPPLSVGRSPPRFTRPSSCQLQALEPMLLIPCIPPAPDGMNAPAMQACPLHESDGIAADELTHAYVPLHSAGQSHHLCQILSAFEHLIIDRLTISQDVSYITVMQQAR